MTPSLGGKTINGFRDPMALHDQDKPFRATELLDADLPAVRHVIEGYLTEGVTVLAGRPKVGKSFLALGLAYAVATGTPALGVPVEQGDALYLALEDSDQRLQARIQAVQHDGPRPDHLYCDVKSPPLDEGGLDRIRAWSLDRPNARLVVIDVFKKVRPKKRRGEDAYDAEYRATDLLKGLADEHGIAILVVYHTRKLPARDPLDTVIGSTGVTAAADAVLILSDTDRGPTLYGRGRDIPQIEIAMSFDADTCRWEAVGAAPEVHRSEQRTAILDLLLGAEEPLKPAFMAQLLDMKPNNLKQLLFRMRKTGEVVSLDGVYVHPDRQDLVPRDDRDNR